jgi:hypothetical protein
MEQKSNSILVGAGKSKRLDAIRKKVSLGGRNNEFNDTQNSQQTDDELTQSAKQALSQARLSVEEKMSSILKAYPPGKANTFFRLKYRIDVQKINTMPLKKVFDLLAIDASNIQHFRMIQNLDYNGVLLESGKTC